MLSSKVSKNVVKSMLLLSLLLFPYYSFAQDINTGSNNVIDKTVSVISKIGDWFGAMYDLILEVSSFILGVFGFIRYGLKTLILGVGKLIGYITGIAEWGEVRYTLGHLSTYIGPVGVMFIGAMLLIIIIRIIYSFFHKLIFRPDYKMSNSKNWEPTDIVEDRTYPRLPG